MNVMIIYTFKLKYYNYLNKQHGNLFYITIKIGDII